MRSVWRLQATPDANRQHEVLGTKDAGAKLWRRAIAAKGAGFGTKAGPWPFLSRLSRAL